MTRDPFVEAARGARLLDQRVPGWYDKVNLDTHSQGSITKCVVAQNFGNDFGEGIKQLFGPAWTQEQVDRHGFASHNYPASNKAWATQIRRRRDGDVTQPSVNENALIDAGRKGVVDLFLAATGRPESDRVLVSHLFS